MVYGLEYGNAECANALAAQILALRWAGEPAPQKRKVWVIARQHPGETMAEFVAEVGPQRALSVPGLCRSPCMQLLLRTNTAFLVGRWMLLRLAILACAACHCDTVTDPDSL